MRFSIKSYSWKVFFFYQTNIFIEKPESKNKPCSKIPRLLRLFYFLYLGYPCKDWLITPFLGEQVGAKKKFNSSQTATRNTIERCFGVIKKRFYILKTGIRLKNMELTSKLIQCCAILHNLCITHGDIGDDLTDSVEGDEIETENLNWQDDPSLSQDYDRRRQQLLQFFV